MCQDGKCNVEAIDFSHLDITIEDIVEHYGEPDIITIEDIVEDLKREKK